MATERIIPAVIAAIRSRFSTQKNNGLADLPGKLTCLSRSALIFPLNTGERQALFICTHRSGPFFREHITWRTVSPCGGPGFAADGISARLDDLQSAWTPKKRWRRS
jgi:hypothetical protein